MNREGAVYGIDPTATVQENAPLIIAARVQEFLQWEPFIKDPRRVEELHRLRIAAKRLRYTLEIFAPILGPPLPAVIERLRTLQDLLGDIHDLDVAVPLLIKRARKAMKTAAHMSSWQESDLAGVLGLCSICRHKQLLRATLYAKLKREWRKFRKERLLEAACQVIPTPE